MARQTKTFQVFDAASFEAALRSASGGDTIELAPGNYGRFVKRKEDVYAEFDAPVTIRSSDPDDPAVFNGMNFRGGKNLVFEDLHFDYSAAPGASVKREAFKFAGIEGLTIRNSVFEGDLAKGVNARSDGFGSGKGLNVINSRDVSIENNEFFHFWKGLIVSFTTDSRIVGNEFHSIRSDGVNAVSNQEILIEGNLFRDWMNAPKTGDHPDMIQFFTMNQRVPQTDITIRGNLFDVGEGQWSQTIWMRNEAVDTGQVPGDAMFYRNVLIEDNVIFNSHQNALHVGAADGVTIRNNTLLHDAHFRTKEQFAPEITVGALSRNVTIADNISSSVPQGGDRPDWNVTNNLIVNRAFAPGQPSYDELFVNALADEVASPADLQAVPGGLIEELGVGAAATRYDPTPDALTPLIRPATGEDRLSFTFDGSLSAGPSGPIGADEASFLWDFGDGTTGTGRTVTHDYATGGDYRVTLRIEDADGTVAESQTLARARESVLFRLEVTADGVSDASWFDTPVQVGPGMVIADDTGGALRFGDKTAIGFKPADIDQIFNLDAFTISFSLRAEHGLRRDAGQIFEMFGNTTIEVLPVGDLKINLATLGGEVSWQSRGAKLLDGQWHDISMTYDNAAGRMEVFLDGSRIGQEAITGQTKGPGSWMVVIGDGRIRGDSFEGLLNNFEILDRALDASDIVEKHGAFAIENERDYAGAPMDPPPPPPAPGDEDRFEFSLETIEETVAGLEGEELVVYLYEQVLGRSADPTGLAYWISALAHPEFGSEELLLTFLESPESQYAV
ncbi:MAG: PKD domain-containing protein [Paracoccaceae bacterium]